MFPGFPILPKFENLKFETPKLDVMTLTSY
jgi:hypothetical protein